MSITVSGRTFLLDLGSWSYGLGVDDAGILTALHWGGRIARVEDLPPPTSIAAYRHRNPAQSSVAAQEFPGWGGQFYGAPALKTDFPDGTRTAALRYRKHEVLTHPDGGELVITLRDTGYPLDVELHYRVWSDTSVLERRAVAVNRGAGVVTLRSLQSACWHPPRTAAPWRVSSISGRWGGEWRIRRTTLTQGRFSLESRTGLSTSFAMPIVAIDEGCAGEAAGQVWFATLLWNGSWRIDVDLDPYEKPVVTGGINDFDWSWPLEPGASFATPAFLGGISEQGFGGASRMLHRHQRQHLAPPVEAERTMPLLFNSWASMGIDVDEARILATAERAARVGAELFVIDDGWQAALGDWTPCPRKFPHGLKPVVDRVRDLGMEFGLWVEIESCELTSRLYREHPEWAMRFANREPLRLFRDDINRSAQLLNFANDGLADNILGQLRTLIRETGITYLKLDMNTLFSDPGWEQVPAAERQTLWVRHARNVTRVLATLKAEFPNLLIENCAAGSGRSDLSMDAICGRMNRSDNQDPLDAVLLHEGFTWLHPSKMAGGGCHISDAGRHINGRETPMRFQALVGMMGSLSIGKNLPQCSDAELAEIAVHGAMYKRIRHLTHHGEMHRLASLADGPHSAFGFVAADRSEALLFAFSREQRLAARIPRLRLRGLDPDAVYAIELLSGGPRCPGTFAPMSGRGLMELGVQLEMVGDCDAALLRLARI